jgi:tumor protein p53-inducible protein 3
MKAILFDRPGDPDVLYMGNRPDPLPGTGELLVRVYATALNRADLLQRKGHYPPPPGESDILGLEIAGEVISTGPGAGDWKPGDRVCGLVGGGGYASLALLPGSQAFPVPEGWSWEMAAAVPEGFLTAWQSLVWLGRLSAGERVLIHAGASGVGTAAIQLARELGAGEILVTASASKHPLCLELGASRAIDYRSVDFSEAISGTTTAQQGVDLIVDCIGGPYFTKNLQILNRDGRLVMLAMMGGANVKEMDLMPLLRNRLQVIGTTLRNRTQDYKARLVQELRQFAWPLFAQERLRPVIDRVFPIEAVVDAHQYMESNKNQGKIILVW